MTDSTARNITTLTTAPVAELLRALFADASNVDRPFRQRFAAIPEAERRAFMSDPESDYRAFYGAAKQCYLAVSEETGRLLYLLGRATRARSIVEFGTSFGISTIHLAAALRDNGGGILIGSELEPEKAARARASLREASLSDLVEIRDGDALSTLARDLPDQVDLVLLDGHKPLYPRILELVEPHLRAGSCLVADNADASPEYLARVRAGGGYLSVPFAEDVELSIRL